MWIWWLVYALLGLVGFIALLAVVLTMVGRSMPARHTYICALALRQPADAVYDAIARVDAWPEWDHNLERVEAAPTADGGLAGRMFFGRNVMAFTTRPIDRPRVHEIDVKDVGANIFSGCWRHELTPIDGGCRIVLKEVGDIHAALPRVMAKVFDPRHYLDRHLRKLAGKFGEPAAIEVIQ